MKKLIFSALSCFTLIICLTMSSCIKDTPFDFTMDLGTVTFTVDTTSTTGVKTFTAHVYTSDLEAQLNNVGASLQDLSSVKLKYCIATILTPGITFDIVDYGEAYISALSLPSAKIAYKAPIAHDGSTTISLDNNYAELAEYAKQSNFTIDLKGYCNTPILNPIDMKMDCALHVSGIIKGK